MTTLKQYWEDHKWNVLIYGIGSPVIVAVTIFFVLPNNAAKIDLEPKIDWTPILVNEPNPQADNSFDSEYLLEIVSDYTIANLPLTIKIPSSIWIMLMYKDNATGDREFYEPELHNGKAFFHVSNAGGSYHVTFASKEPVKINKDDISW